MNTASRSSPTWKKWILIGASAGVSLELLSAIILGGSLLYSSRTLAWNSDALSVVWSEARETLHLDEKALELTHAGFSLTYGFQNNTAHDITIPADAEIMKRLAKGSTLVDYSSVAKPYKSYFIPAHQRAEFSPGLHHKCDEQDLATGTVRSRDPRACFNEAFADSDGLVLLDHSQRLQINLPQPALK